MIRTYAASIKVVDFQYASEQLRGARGGSRHLLGVHLPRPLHGLPIGLGNFALAEVEPARKFFQLHPRPNSEFFSPWTVVRQRGHCSFIRIPNEKANTGPCIVG